MLNKKAQVEDNIEFVLCILGLIIGVVVLTLLKADYAWSIDHAKNAWRAGTEIPPFDTQFMGTDLLNTAKIPIGGYTFGELITYMPRNYQGIKDPQFETLFWDQWFVDALACDEELYTVLNDYLSPVYGKYWDITVFYKEEKIFRCHPSGILYGFGPVQTNMTLPSINPHEELVLLLEVYQ